MKNNFYKNIYITYNCSNKKFGFTLIEMIIVLSIIGILIGFSSPSIKNLANQSIKIDLDSKTYSIYNIICDIAIDNTKKDIKEVFNFNKNPMLFNSLNLDETEVMFIFKTDTSNLDYELVTHNIPENYVDKYIVVIPINNITNNFFDFTKNIYIFQPHGEKTLLNGNFTY